MDGKAKRYFFVSLFCLLLCGPPHSALAGTPVPHIQFPAAAASSDPVQAEVVSGAAALQGMAVAPSANKEYVLGVGDRIKLTVYGETDLSGEYEVGSTGVVALPLVGDVPVASQSISAFEQAVRAKLTQGYLKDPRVSAQVVNYRPFFILGEVSKPGSYPYVNGMTVINAVALAGGYTYRADKSGVTVAHANDSEKKDTSVSEEAVVMPGDIIRVPERFF